MKKHNHITLIQTLFVLGLFAGGCNKDKGESPAKETYDFSYSGSQRIGGAISFESNAPAISKFSWLFDDSIISNDPKPIFRYYDLGIHTVKLIVDNDSLNSISKELNITGGMERLIGNYVWQRSVRKGEYASGPKPGLRMAALSGPQRFYYPKRTGNGGRCDAQSHQSLRQ